jgi:hypothetical protein
MKRKLRPTDEKPAEKKKISEISEEKPQLITQTDDKEKSMFKNFMKKLMGKLFTLPESAKDNPDVAEKLNQQKNKFENWLENLELTPKVQREEAHKFKNCEDRKEELLYYYKNLITENSKIDRQQIIIELLRKTASFYKENINEEISPWQLSVFVNYSRNYALLSGNLIPDLYQLVTCARSCADDNYAYEVWDLSTYYPWIDESGAYRTIDIHADEVYPAEEISLLQEKNATIPISGAQK